MSISIRRSIQRFPNPPSEPTSTLVLTSPRQSYFVDVRVLDPSVPPCLADPSSAPARPLSPLGGSSVRRAATALDWAFAGTSVRSVAAPLDPIIGAPQHVHGELATADGNGTKRHRWQSKWTHWVDSQTIHPDDVEDEGEMEETGPNETTERGKMLHPQTGAVQHYEEIWQDLPVAGSKPSPVVTAKPGGEHIAMVLVAESTALSARGMIIRVGQWCQGVLRCGADVSCERWCLRSPEQQGDGQWGCVFKIGEGSLPCAVLWQREGLVVGEEICSHGLTWRCEERSVW